MQQRQKGKFIMNKIIKKTINQDSKPTKHQIAEIQTATNRTITFDEDSPELSYEEMLQMIKTSKPTNRKKAVVTLRVSASTLDKAKAVGKGYTSFLSRLVDNAINDKDLVSRSL